MSLTTQEKTEICKVHDCNTPINCTIVDKILGRKLCDTHWETYEYCHYCGKKLPKYPYNNVLCEECSKTYKKCFTCGDIIEKDGYCGACYDHDIDEARERSHEPPEGMLIE